MNRRMVPMATTSPRLRELVCRDMLRGAIGALAKRVAAFTQSELLSLVRDILFQELPHSPSPEQARLHAGLHSLRLGLCASQPAQIWSGCQPCAASRFLSCYTRLALSRHASMLAFPSVSTWS